MAQTLRQLTLAAAGVGLVLLPLLPGLVPVFAPALVAGHWQTLFADPQVGAALGTTVLTAVGSSLLALLLACGLALALHPGKHWHPLQRQLPLLLAFPHAAFAIGLAFLLAPSGWLARGLAPVWGWSAPPQWVTVQDPYGLTLLLALALKESAFLLWVLAGLLGEQWLTRQMTIAHSLGYGRWQTAWHIILPQLLPRLAWPLLAVFAYSLSVVDMALILGPSTPPTLAVLGWQWFSDPDPTTQVKGHLVAVLLLLLLLAWVGVTRSIFWGLRQWGKEPTGVRWETRSGGGGEGLIGKTAFLVPSYLALCTLLLWSVAGAWFFPALLPAGLTLEYWQRADFQPLFTTLLLSGCTVLLALPLCLLWLEWGSRWQGWLYFPLVLPALPLAAAQYQVLLHLHLDNTALGVVWSHLAWVLPYMILVLAGAYHSLDPRYLLTAKALGYSHWQACWRIKWPILLHPILAAIAVGFAVSVAQYLPTLFAGGGRIETVTTEAVALSAGGNRHTLAVQAVLQAVLPLLAFALAGLLGWLHVRRHLGLR